jgi:NADPH-dependent curcumin reductase CurA
MAAQYNATSLPVGPDRLSWLMGLILRRRLTVRGFIIFQDFGHLYPRFATAMADLLAAGHMVLVEEMIEGLEAAPLAFSELLRGESFGKHTVRAGPAHTPAAHTADHKETPT